MRLLPKFDALVRLHRTGLPHPDWRFSDQKTDLPPQPWSTADVGWSLRQCPLSYYAFGLPSRHYITYAEALLMNRIWIRETHMATVSYPSWRFICSGCCLLTPALLTVEAVSGSPAGLLAGTKTPELVAQFDRFSHQRYLMQGSPAVIPDGLLERIVSYSGAIDVNTEVTVEWSITHNGRLVFHDWVQVI